MFISKMLHSSDIPTIDSSGCLLLIAWETPLLWKEITEHKGSWWPGRKLARMCFPGPTNLDLKKSVQVPMSSVISFQPEGRGINIWRTEHSENRNLISECVALRFQTH
ncbi:hypothetical protein GDO78_015543 [Eleutherodactylus coqui]|uniref:Uncharacterized protein n=1 Tax=Eleutherodactylus coqui TaxID=57060 RepID=A0A8J6JP00_ELECQ|nr:hypothetical protein GDO78_015543 [Eleutherodactylus coqui]